MTETTRPDVTQRLSNRASGLDDVLRGLAITPETALSGRSRPERAKTTLALKFLDGGRAAGPSGVLYHPV